jgi:site-specific recombinase XerD
LVTIYPDEHIRKGVDQLDWIYKERDKSREMAMIPFSAKPFALARQILAQYNGKLPIVTNQTYNRLLKEIAAVVGIKKHVTSHVARKTAAMQWLNAGVPEETVARMLGHNSTKQLKVYAQVQEKKIAKDIEFLG